jgi:hypothetical protein
MCKYDRRRLFFRIWGMTFQLTHNPFKSLVHTDGLFSLFFPFPSLCRYERRKDDLSPVDAASVMGKGCFGR